MVAIDEKTGEIVYYCDSCEAEIAGEPEEICGSVYCQNCLDMMYDMEVRTDEDSI